MNYNPSNPFGIFIDWKQALGYSRCGLCSKRNQCDILDLYGKCQEFEMTKDAIIFVKEDNKTIFSACNTCAVKDKCHGRITKNIEDCLGYVENKPIKICKTCNKYFSCYARLNDYEYCPGGEPYIPRCNKCVYSTRTCGHTDNHGECKQYKRDPPDGGYYG